MKQSKIISAYKVVEKISNDKDLTSDISFIFYKIRKKLQDQWDFQNEQETKLFEKYHPKYEEERLIFESPEQAKQFSKELQDLADLEVDLGEINKIDFHPDSKIKMSVEDMIQLEDFLNYI